MKERNEKIVGASLLAMIVVLMGISVAAAVPWEGYLIPQHSTGNYDEDTAVELWVEYDDTGLTYGAVAYQVDIHFDPICVNITGTDFSTSPFAAHMFTPYAPGVVRILEDNYATMMPISSGTYKMATLTLHGTCSESCTCDIWFDTNVVSDTDGNPITNTYTNGTYTCAIEYPSQLVINEFVAKPNITQTTEWIELYNPTGGDVSLDGWTIEDNTGSTYGSGSGDTALDGKTVPANGYLVLNKSEGDFGFALNDGDDIIILKNATAEVDRVAYGNFDDGNIADNAPTPDIDNSTGRFPNGVDTDNDSADFRVFDNPTPGAPNTEAGEEPTADSFGVEDASGRSGTYVEVPINITNVMNGPVLGIGFEIAYDKNVINVTDVSKGNLVPSNWADPNVNNNFTGGTKITIAGFYAADAIPNGTSGSVVLLNFSVIGSPGDTSPMNMTLIELANPDGDVGTAPAKNGTFRVSELGSIVGRITYTCNETGIAGAVVNLTNESIVNTTVTNETGYYNFTDVIPGSYFVNASKPGFWDNSTEVAVIAGETTTADMMLWLKGDLNGDGKSADTGDLVLMNRASVGEIVGDWRYDLNKNGIIADVGDLVLMNRASVKDIELL
jgi:hypothetical protein